MNNSLEKENKLPREKLYISIYQPYSAFYSGIVVKKYWTCLMRDEQQSIYQVIDYFAQNIYPNMLMTIEKVEKAVPLRELITLHNSDGIRSTKQISNMVRHINDGNHIQHSNGIVNVKLVITSQNEYVLFDGHHSVLAYMASGKLYLQEIPHMVVLNSEGYIEDDEILVFFGDHKKTIMDPSWWRAYVINWQAPFDKQLCKRIEKNMGDLFDSIYHEL